MYEGCLSKSSLYALLPIVHWMGDAPVSGGESDISFQSGGRGRGAFPLCPRSRRRQRGGHRAQDGCTSRLAAGPRLRRGRGRGLHQHGHRADAELRLFEQEGPPALALGAAARRCGLLRRIRLLCGQRRPLRALVRRHPAGLQGRTGHLLRVPFLRLGRRRRATGPLPRGRQRRGAVRALVLLGQDPRPGSRPRSPCHPLRGLHEAAPRRPFPLLFGRLLRGLSRGPRGGQDGQGRLPRPLPQESG